MYFLGVRSVIVLADGDNNYGTHTQTEAINFAVQLSIPVYTIGLGISSGSSAEQNLQAIAQQTGGVYYRAPTSSDLANIYQSLSQQLNNQYLITYTTHNSTTDGSIRIVSITANYNSLTDTKSKQYTAPSGNNYSISIIPITQNAKGSTGTLIPIQIKVGDPNQLQSPDDFLGVSFNLNWDNAQYIEYSGSSTPGAFLGNNPITIVQAFTDHIEAGLTRTTGGTTGSGIVLSFSLKVKADAPDSTLITLSLSNITAIKSNGSSLTLTPVGNSTITLNTGLTVWPGDANNDGVVNAADVLPLGLYYNKTGLIRPNASINWVGQLCTPWNTEQATYADCNGDGIVNATDVLAIGFNYGKTHTTSNIKVLTSIRKVNATGSISMISVNGNSFTADTAGSVFEIDVKVGDPDQVTSFLGASFNLTWSDTTLIEAVSTTAGSFLGNNSLVVGQNFIDHIEAGVTSSTGGHDGSGIIAKLKLRIKKPISVSTNIDFNLTNITAIDATGGSIDLAPANNPLTIGIITDVEDETIPTSYSLSQNYPNPFNPSTTIRYTIPKQSFVTLKIYNVLGEEIKTLINKELNIGVYEVNFDAGNLASGIYFYSLKAGNFASTKKLILLK